MPSTILIRAPFGPLALFCCLCACDGDRAAPHDVEPPSGGDASTAEAPGLMASDAGARTTDAAAAPASVVDAHAPDADVPNMAEITAVVGNTGRIEVADNWIQGDFNEDDTILHVTSAPECVAFLRSGTKLRSLAGTLSVSSDLVGQPGGPPQPIEVVAGQAPPIREYWHDLSYGCSSSSPTCADAPLPDVPVLFRFPDAARVQVQLQGSVAFPPLPVTTLRAPAFPPVEVLAPLPPEAVDLMISTTQAFTVRWVPPPADAGVPASIAENQRLIVELRVFAFVGQDTSMAGEIFCAFPLATGQGNVPAVLLGEVRDRFASPESDFGGGLILYAGELKEVSLRRTSYVILTDTFNSASPPYSVNVTFD